eukprot:scaffold196168_cov38-Tisochrysis_lutea.AAC.2
MDHAGPRMCEQAPVGSGLQCTYTATSEVPVRTAHIAQTACTGIAAPSLPCPHARVVHAEERARDG